jgi:3-dehydroquinate dehydratase
VTTKAIQACLDGLALRAENEGGEATKRFIHEARAELAEIRKAAKTLDRLGIGDFTYNIRDRVSVIASTHNSESTWNHPDVKAWSDASVLLATIAKES